MGAKAKVKTDALCIEEKEAIDLVSLTAGLIDTMKDQAKRLKEGGYDTTKIEKQIKGVKRRLNVARKHVKV